MAMELTDDQVITLVQEYERYPVLWDPKDKFYKINNKKKDAWAEIGAIFQIEAEMLKKKMNSLLSSYRRERNKTGKSTWFAYNAFHFLHDIYTPRKSLNIMEVGIDFVDDMEEEPEEEVFPEFVMPADQDESDTHEINRDPSPPPSKKRKTQKNKYDQRMDVAWSSLQTIGNRRREKDQFDAFGQYIAETLRQMDYQSAIYAKKAINDVIFQAELGRLPNHVNDDPVTAVENNCSSSSSEEQSPVYTQVKLEQITEHNKNCRDLNVRLEEIDVNNI